jgi:hypothetical protein
VNANGELVYLVEYLSCRNHSPIGETSIRLASPSSRENMWLFGEGNDGVIGFLADGNILLPVSLQNKCSQVKARLVPSQQ